MPRDRRQHRHAKVAEATRAGPRAATTVHATSSPTSGPARTERASSRSSALRAIGPCTPITTAAFGRGGIGNWPLRGNSVSLGRWPYTPQKAAGTRMEPPMSEPTSRALSPAAMAAALPPLLPPGRPGEIPGIAGAPEDRVGGLPVGEHGRHVRLAEQHRAGRAAARGDGPIVRRDVALPVRHPAGGAEADDVDGLLEGHRQAQERLRLVAAPRLVGRASPAAARARSRAPPPR